MTTRESSLCPTCQAALPSDAPGGDCPACLLRLGGGERGRPMGFAINESANGKTGFTLPHRFADYELLEEIARGGMGIVFKARQLRLSRVVAVKLILAAQFAGEEFLERFRLETQTLGRLEHPPIAKIHETGIYEGVPYFSMEYVGG